ncbi:glycosyltransferase WbuB [Cupriavidus sp. UYPR2.512]|uniref:glycosyltransferase WbuB n=1 Tax=Cupriavidus sp. UYPR2.512 TaxID=1080187 RepID=UPI000376B258|nr:glycosyltransferase WbuB [Cupriavidus sp. UYPR2.512]UIF85839.1 glycosyltransferase WbuB [Cupriavidus necator]
MKILICGQNYAPELTGTGKYTAEMAEAMAAAGHEVRVLCGPPYYPAWRVEDGYSAWRYRREQRGGVRVQRVPLWVPRRPGGLNRLLHLGSFALAALPALLAQAWWRPDVVMVVAPGLMSAPGGWLLSRLTGALAWLHLQDYEVDAAFELGLLRGAGARRAALAVERALLRGFDVVSTISEKMTQAAARKGVPAARIVLLPNWVDADAIHPLDRPSAYREFLGIAPHQKVVLYAGNMGAKQGLDVLMCTAAALAGQPDIVFVFCGNGPARQELELHCAGLENCRFIPLQPTDRLNELLNLADIHVLPQRGGAADLVMPSKLTGMLASGRAIVAMAEGGTELFAALSGRGVAVPPEDAEALAHAIRRLAADPAQRAALGAAARAYAVSTLSAPAVLGRLEARLRVLRAGGAAAEAEPAPRAELTSSGLRAEEAE